MSGTRFARDLGLPCLVFLVLATVNAAVIPWFEYPDEKNHIHYAQFVARKRALPPMVYAVVDDGEQTARVAFNPPLYYWIASRFLDPRTPFVSPEVSWAPRGARGFSEPPRCGWGSFGDLPSRLSLLRCLSILFGLVTVMSCWGIGRLVRPADPSLGSAMAWIPVLIPQFVSMSAAINNEGLAVAFASLATLTCVRSAIGGRASTAGFAGLWLGAAAMAKVSALALAPALGLAVFRGKGGWGRLAALTIATCCVAGPWLFRNWVEHRDPMGMRMIEAVEANRCAGRHPTDLRGIARGAGVSAATGFLWYGQLAVRMRGVLYALPAAIVLMSGMGLLRSRQAPHDAMSFGLISWVALLSLLAAYVAYNMRVYSPQGRYLYIGSSVLAYLLATGLLAWIRLERRALAILLFGVLGAVGQVAFLLLVVGPEFAR